MKVLVVGGAGYVGGALTDLLSQSQHDFLVYDSLVFEDYYLKPVPFIRGDVRDVDKLQSFLDWADVVVWLAAIVGDGACAINPMLTLDVNQISTKRLTDRFDGRIIFMSTCSVYGAADGTLDETSPTNPLSLYAQTKLESESYLLGRDSIIFRLGTLFGVADNFSRVRLDLVLNTLTARALSDGKLTVFGGDQWRPLLHVRDAALEAFKAIDSDCFGIYNLHHSNMNISDLAQMVVEEIPAKIERVETTFEDSRNYMVTSDKARKALGFQPKNDPGQGVTEFAQLLRSGRIKDLNSPRYSNHGFLESLQ